MSLYETLSLVVSAAGFAGLALSIYFLSAQTSEVAAQSRSAAQALEATTFDASATTMFLVDSAFLEHPELRAYFYDGEHLPAESNERARALAMAEMLLDYFDYILIQMKSFPILYPANFWTGYIADSFDASPVLCEYLARKRHWYSDELLLTMRDATKTRQSLHPESQ